MGAEAVSLNRPTAHKVSAGRQGSAAIAVEASPDLPQDMYFSASSAQHTDSDRPGNKGLRPSHSQVSVEAMYGSTTGYNQEGPTESQLHTYHGCRLRS